MWYTISDFVVFKKMWYTPLPPARTSLSQIIVGRYAKVSGSIRPPCISIILFTLRCIVRGGYQCIVTILKPDICMMISIMTILTSPSSLLAMVLTTPTSTNLFLQLSISIISIIVGTSGGSECNDHGHKVQCCTTPR